MWKFLQKLLGKESTPEVVAPYKVEPVPVVEPDPAPVAKKRKPAAPRKPRAK